MYQVEGNQEDSVQLIGNFSNKESISLFLMTLRARNLDGIGKYNWKPRVMEINI